MNSEAYGPPLPPGYKQGTNDESQSSNKNNRETKIIGPQCPQNFLINQRTTEDQSSYDPSIHSDIVGPALPAGFPIPTFESDDESSEPEGAFGPMPITKITEHEDDVYDIVAGVEKRAKDMKRKLDGSEELSSKKLEREEWMTVPNTSSRNQLGAISRCLSNSSSKSHRNDSSKKEKKHHHKSSKEEKKLAEELKHYNKSKRSESLLEMHRKSRKKKEKEKGEKPAERKPFNRDDDMSLRLMNKNQVKSVIDKAKYLDSRFSRGQSKYL